MRIFTKYVGYYIKFALALILVFNILCLTPSCTPTPSNNKVKQHVKSTILIPEELFRKGINLYRMKKYTEAIETFHEFIGRYPDHPDLERAHYYIVRCHEHSLEEMSVSLEDFIKKYPQSKHAAELLFKLAKKYEYSKNVDKALELYKRVSIQFNQHDDIAIGALNKIAKIYRKRKDMMRVMATYEQIANNFPFSEGASRALFFIALIQEDNKDFVSAYYTYLRIRNAYPEFRTTTIESKISFYEADWNHNGIPNFEEWQAGKDAGSPPE